MSSRNVATVPVMWEPTEKYGHVMRKFKNIIEDKYQINIGDYWDFHKWSVDHIVEFWTEIWDFFGVVCSKKFDKIIDLKVPLQESPKWFEGARINLAENLLKYRDEKVAFILAGEDRETEKVTFAQMYEEASLYAAAFRKFGLKKGDIVVCQMPNRKEAVIAMQAVVSIGAIWTGALPLLGAQAVLGRIKQVNPKIFLTIDRFLQQGEEIDMLPKVMEISGGLPSLEKVIIIGSKKDSHLKNISGIKNSCFLEEFLELGRDKDRSVPPMQFEQVSFSHPVFISYTSGTTGLPKALVHGAGMFLAAARDFAIHTDCSRNSVWFSMSPVGWGTWNLFCSLHFLGLTLSLFEGVPYFLSPHYFWDLVEDHKITHLFIPAGTIDEFQKRGYVPTDKHTLKSLRLCMAGGSVVKPEVYDFMYDNGKKDIPFASGFGCTEFLGSSMIVETTLPVHKGEIPAVSLGCDIKAVDSEGKPVYGEMGELVLTNPMPNLPLGIWGDEDGSVYRKKYFTNIPGKFSMGDYAIINPITKGIKICGRSDETLKQRGCRFGSSEIYSVVDMFPEVRDSLCVSQYNAKMDERAVLFLKMRDGYTFSEEIVIRIREAITRELTVRHVPDVIIETKEVPYNINNKKMEITVKNIINKRPYNADTVSNPDCLKNFQDVPKLQGF